MIDSFIDIFYFWPFSWLLLQLFHLTLIAWAFLLYYHNPFTSLRIISKSVKEVFSNKGYYYDPNQFVKLIMCAHVTNVRIEYCISFLKILFCIHQGIVLTFAEVSYYQQKRHKKYFTKSFGYVTIIWQRICVIIYYGNQKMCSNLISFIVVIRYIKKEIPSFQE